MDLDDALRRYAGGGVQPVNVLGDDVGDVAQLHQPRHRPVAWTGFCLGDGLADHQEAPPCLEAGVFGGQKRTVFDGLVARPEAAGRAEVGNAAFGGDAGAGEHHRAPGALDQTRQFIYLFLKQRVTP